MSRRRLYNEFGDKTMRALDVAQANGFLQLEFAFLLDEGRSI